MTLPGPVRTIVVEPLELPAALPAPKQPPVAPPPPREPQPA